MSGRPSEACSLAGLSEDDAVTTTAVVLIKGVIGGGEKLVKAAVSLVGDGNADGDGDPQRGYGGRAIQGNGKLENLFPDSFGDLSCLACPGVGEQDRELFAAESPGDVVRAHLRLDEVGH